MNCLETKKSRKNKWAKQVVFLKVVISLFMNTLNTSSPFLKEPAPYRDTGEIREGFGLGKSGGETEN
jgi:hypothetical protein